MDLLIDLIVRDFSHFIVIVFSEARLVVWCVVSDSGGRVERRRLEALLKERTRLLSESLRALFAFAVLVHCLLYLLLLIAHFS